MHAKGERWLTHDNRVVVITTDLANNHLRVLNQSGRLEVITESELKERLP